MLKILITVDVETSIGGAFAYPDKFRPVGPEKRIYGRIGSKEYGIPLIMDILESFGLKGIFFVEALCSFYFGEKAVQEVARYVASRGHEVGLHLHPNYQIFQFEDWPERVRKKELFSDFMARYPFDHQKELISYGRHLLEKAGVQPISFRAGCFGANNDTLKALKETGFFFDSSFDLSMQGVTCFIKSHKPLNDIAIIEDIVETPVTNFWTKNYFLKSVLRHFDLCAVSFSEIKYLLERMANKFQLVTFILHSFSFLKKRDVQYHTAKPNYILIKRFEKLCRYLSNNSDRYQVITYHELQNFNICPSDEYKIPKGKTSLALIRYFSQALQYM